MGRSHLLSGQCQIIAHDRDRGGFLWCVTSDGMLFWRQTYNNYKYKQICLRRFPEDWSIDRVLDYVMLGGTAASRLFDRPRILGGVSYEYSVGKTSWDRVQSGIKETLEKWWNFNNLLEPMRIAARARR
jgi:hypothetical protein